MKKLSTILFLLVLFISGIAVTAIDQPQVYVKSGSFSKGVKVTPEDVNKLSPNKYVIVVTATPKYSGSSVIVSSATYHLDTIHEGSSVACSSVTIYAVIHGTTK